MFNHTFKHLSTALALILGAVLILLGLIGFVSNPIFGIFETNTISNLVLILFGLGGVFYGADTRAKARNYGVVLGVLLAVASIYGYLYPNTEFLGFVPTTYENNALNLIVSLFGFGTGAIASMREERAVNNIYTNTANNS